MDGKTDMSDAIDMTMTVSTRPTERDLIRTEYSVDERERMLARMMEIKDSFYAAAQRVGHHQFIEFAGFMAEYIKICARMHRDGVDFGTVELAPKHYEMEYVAEKFDCIFGGGLMEPVVREAFLGVLGAKGGWAIPEMKELVETKEITETIETKEIW
jgi:hypothetical protein